MIRLSPFALFAAAAFALAALFTLFVRRACIRWRVYDSPGPLKIHSRPIPRLGGVAITLALAATLGIAAHEQSSFGVVWPFFAALGLIWITGLIDDLRGLPPAIRIVAQFAAAALLWQAGWRLPWPHDGVVGFAASAIFLIVFVNAFNFLDGADGVAASVAAVLAIIYAAHPAALLAPFATSVAAALLGVCAGFLLFNLPPAKIFMGDSGSTMLGFAVAFLSLEFYRSNAAEPKFAAFPLVVAALPLLDAALAVTRRLQNRASPFYGDRRHFYDLLLSRGWRPHKVVLACVAITAGLGVAAAESLRIRLPIGAAIEFLCLGSLFAAAIGLGSLHLEDAPPPSAPGAIRGASNPPGRARFRSLTHRGASHAKP